MRLRVTKETLVELTAGDLAEIAGAGSWTAGTSCTACPVPTLPIGQCTGSTVTTTRD